MTTPLALRAPDGAASRTAGRRAVASVVTALCGLLAACGTTTVPTPNAASVFKQAHKTDKVEFMSPQDLALIEATTEVIHRIGPGDALSLQVWGRPELTTKLVVGPDGVVTVPISGSLRLEALTRDEGAALISKQLARYYDKPHVTLGVDLYTSNRITVLGRVQSPGPIAFDNAPTLLEVLAKAGSLPVIDKQATLTRCAIFRGRDKVIWVDIARALSGGQVAYNLRMKPGDMVYIPDSSDTMVYVLGSVQRPGAYRLTPGMSALDALAQAGGPTEDASNDEIGIYRPDQQAVEKVPLSSLMKADRQVNFAMSDGDVIYVPKSGIAEFGYVTRQLAAGLSLMTVNTLFTKSNSAATTTTTTTPTTPANPAAFPSPIR
jgi:polysaccharide export outer membrane protein